MPSSVFDGENETFLDIFASVDTLHVNSFQTRPKTVPASSQAFSCCGNEFLKIVGPLLARDLDLFKTEILSDLKKKKIVTNRLLSDLQALSSGSKMISVFIRHVRQCSVENRLLAQLIDAIKKHQWTLWSMLKAIATDSEVVQYLSSLLSPHCMKAHPTAEILPPYNWKPALFCCEHSMQTWSIMMTKIFGNLDLGIAVPRYRILGMLCAGKRTTSTTHRRSFQVDVDVSNHFRYIEKNRVFSVIHDSVKHRLSCTLHETDMKLFKERFIVCL